MNEPNEASAGSYDPGRRTGLVLAGAGTAGAYHAGVLRAIHESGVRVDVVAGCGIGAVGAAFSAIDAGLQVWGPDGLWKRPEIRRSYSWRLALRAAGWSLAIAFSSLILPVFALAAGVVAYLGAYLAQVSGIPGGGRLAAGYSWLMGEALASDALPALLPRLAVLGLAFFAVAVAAAAASSRDPRRRRSRGGLWWTLLAAPLTSKVLAAGVRSRLWRVIAGAPGRREPAPEEFSRLYCDLLAENLGQPHFKELLILAHDLDARQDVAFALLARPWRRAYFGRHTGEGIARAGEAFDLAGAGSVHFIDALMASLALPGLTEPTLVTFPAESYWRGETHALAARMGSVGRLLLELSRAGVEQVILVCASTPGSSPRSLRRRPVDPAGRLGETLTASDASAALEAVKAGPGCFKRIFPIFATDEPLTALDFGGCYDERSDRPCTLVESIERGYRDAYRQFIEPHVAVEEQGQEQG
ncbi:MAG: patatin-like phospholipase family protein [Vicinamibacterales bacterium]